MSNQANPGTSGRKKALLIGGGAVVVAAIAVIFVLPAETGIDPTGLGEQSGLTQMANPSAAENLARGAKRQGVLTPLETIADPEPGVSDHWTYEIQPYGEIELKYKLEKDAPITFAWSADGPLNMDMHAHPFDGGEALTESYAITETDHQAGRYVAAFSGIHGWHWQNRGLTPVTLTLDASGKISGSQVLDGRSEQDRELTPKP